MRVNYSDWWNDVVAIARANSSILVAVAGAFAFLPAMIAAFLLVPMVPPPEGSGFTELLAAYSDYYRENWPTQLVVFLLTTLGQLLLYVVLLDRRRPAVGEALRLAVPLFLPFFVANILVSLLLAGGLMLLFVPALYLVGRIMLTPAAFVSETRPNPVAAVARSFALTRRQGWRIFFFVFLVYLVVLVVQIAIGGTLSAALSLFGGSQDPFSVGRLLLAALQAAFTSVLFVFGVVLWVALYRRLAGGGEASSAT
ncbi:MAG TPA: hypothetical protein VEZ48_07045 [Sphingomonadaceae bacterium]|nr:hypothetical protein [Sphingomonadaceae bacterium]